MKTAGIFFIVLFLAGLTFNLGDLVAGEKFEPVFPLGVDKDVFSIPSDNPMTKEKVELGRLLYFDPRLSADGTVSCATCHDPAKGFTDQIPVSKGIKGRLGARNAPTVLNSTFNYFQFWDGRALSLEDQAKGPIENPIEMGNTHEDAVENISKIAAYKPYFKAAYGDWEVTIDRIANAIATFERTVLSGNSAWDRHVQNNDQTALNESAKRGLELFEGKARCTQCHVGFNLTDGLFHNIGVGMSKGNPDLGRYEITKKEEEKGAFKTPILRDLLKTAPYMHDGSVGTLEEVMDFYNKGGESNPWLDQKMQALNLTDQEKGDLVAFMESLEGDWKPEPAPKLPEWYTIESDKSVEEIVNAPS
ncbi:MAG: c-type cytochrome [Candidatus Omnitrophica bacterium]|nr:c-type cytochrome [Candidatus Omnitrophota bacterium]